MNDKTATAITNPSLPEQLTLDLVQASIAAEQAFGGQPVVLPTGWTQVAEITGWVASISGGHEEMFGLLLQSSTDSGQLIVAFRGTKTDADGITEAFYHPTDYSAYIPSKTPVPTPQVGTGFFAIYAHKGSSMASSMQAQVFALLDKYSPTQLYLTGHSLGGALAELLALDVSLCLTQTPCTIITFAAPMVGIQTWASAYAKGPGPQTTRVVNQYDVVPRLPPSRIAPNYTQVGQEFAMAFQPQTEVSEKQKIAIDHATTNYQYVLQQALPLPGQQWAGTFPDLSGVGQNITDVSTLPS